MLTPLLPRLRAQATHAGRWLLLLICWLTAAGGVRAQTVTVGSTAVPVVAPATSTYLYGPIYRFSVTSTTNYSRYAHLYTPAELGVPVGAVITQLAWLKTDAGELTGNNVFNVLLDNTTSATLATGTTWSALSTGATSVYASATQQVTGAAGSYFSVTLSQPFTYTGGNLLVLLDHAKQGTATGVINFVTNPATGLAIGTASTIAFTPTTTLSTLSYGNRRPTLRLTYAPGMACTAPPTAGTTLASAASVCSGNTVELRLQGASFGTGQTYQWQESVSGATYTDIVGATSPTYTPPPLLATRSYRARLTCSGQAATSAPVQVSVSQPTYATLPVAQSFEATWLDVCNAQDAPTASWRTNPATGNAAWRRDDDGLSAGWTSPTFGGYTPTGSQGTRSARFHSYTAGAGGIGNLDLYVNMNASGNKVLTFDYVNTAGNDSLKVLVSTDGGATFGAPVLKLGTSGTVAQGFQSQSVSIVATSATTVIRFQGKVTATLTSDIGVDNVGLDILSGVPNCAINLNPANNATGIVRSPVITWAGGGGVPTSYDVYFGTSATPPLVVTQATTSYTPATGLAANTDYYYRIVPRNANGPATGCPAVRFTTTSTFTYCTTNLGGSSCAATDNISAVSVGGTTLNNPNTTCNTVGGSTYTQFPGSGSTTGTLLQGLAYQVSVTVTSASITSVWIDFNQSGTFEATEWTQISASGTANQAATAGVTVPLNAVPGQTTMRVRSRTNGSPNGAPDACTNFFSGETEDYIVTIGPAPGCAPPTALSAGSIGTTSATLGFVPGTGGVSFTVIYGPQGFDPATGGTTTITTGAAVSVTNLTANTTYQFYVRKECGGGTTSQLAGPFTFVTACLPAVFAPLPVIESFEATWLNGCNTRDIPTNSWRNTPATGNAAWRRSDDAAAAAWTSPTLGTYSPISSQGTHSARFHSYAAGAGALGTLDLYVNLSAAGNKRLTFDYVNTAGNDSLLVSVSTDGGNTFGSPVLRLGNSGTVAQGFQSQNVTLAGTSATGIVRFRTKVTATFTSDIGLDNVRVESLTGCLTPVGLVVVGTTANSAVVAWASAGTNPYTVFYGPVGFTPGGAGSQQLATITGTTTTIPGLTASTEYQFYVRQDCGGSSSGNAGPVTFRTDCVTPVYATLPVLESFENTWLSRCDTREVPTTSWRNAPATGNNSWRREDDGVTGAWVNPNLYAYAPTGSTGSHSARFHSGQASSGLIGTFDLFVNLSAAGAKQLSFDFFNTSGNDSLTIHLSTDGGATFGPALLRLNQSGTVAAGFSQRALVLNTAAATAVIRFRGRADFGITDIGLDNIRLESAAGCLAPVNLAVSSTTTTSAVVTWQGTGTGTYTLQYGPAGFVPGSGTTVGNATSPYTIPGLAPGTQYQFYVSQSCGGTPSGLAGPVGFTTQIINDDPCGATPLTLGSDCTAPVQTTNAGATSTVVNGYTNPGGCGPAGLTAPRDVWFKFRTAASGRGSTEVTLTVTGTPANVVRVFTGAACAGPLAPVTGGC
ncbi:MAG: fibronectin type III domain-containing protein, partial [Hymenobacter sp.]|nr:fibronectin type III domain-containing protein [Hymenobacter sp.]